ncbi:MAG: aminomethyl-transferring glycine dehydrogenase subunit GcvPB [Candidatus Anammoxibacter sp.]
MKLIFEKTKKGRCAVSLPALDVPLKKDIIPESMLRNDVELPEISEIDIVRHYTALSRMNYGLENGFYPLGSCTMKYNPKICEETANLDGFAGSHPLQPLNQGCLQIMFELEQMLCELCGVSRFTLQPSAGAHGELTGLMILKAYFKDKCQKRTKIIIPDSSHGTNPASVAMCGFNVVQIKSNEKGCVDIEELRNVTDDEVAALMITNPNTLGIFEKDIIEICKIIHDKGGFVYMDGANMNACVGKVRPGDLGIDILHLNLHKTFSTPHGSGGPGAGPVGLVEQLVPYLPNPAIEYENGKYILKDSDKSIGKMRAFYGSFGVIVRAYTYLVAIGANGLKSVSENAVLNANYLMERLKKHYKLPYDRVCQHEFVLSDEGMPNGITTMEVAKQLIDCGFYAPTIYFPLIVNGAMMIEPTETEPKEMLDHFIDTMVEIKNDASTDPAKLKNAPQNTPVTKLDAVQAARKPILRWQKV